MPRQREIQQGRAIMAHTFTALACRLLLVLLAMHGCTAPRGAAAAGPCSSTSITIAVYRASDIYTRLQYKATQTVRLELQRDLLLTAPVRLLAGFSCTILTSASSGRAGATAAGGYALRYASPSGSRFPLLQATNVSNLVLTKLSFTGSTDPDAARAMCGPAELGREVGYGADAPCPGALVYRAWGVTVSHVAFTGLRLDLFRVTQSVVQACAFELGGANLAGARVGLAGSAPGLVKSGVVLQHNRFRGGVEAVLLFRGAVGVTVRRNEIVNPRFTGVQCGSGTSNAGDCMLNAIDGNRVNFEPGFAPVLDASGFYFDTHWTNPGNSMRCNYVLRGRHCLYLDYATSGVTVDGLVCAHNLDGVKLNAGHNNLVSGVVTVNHTECGGWMSCQNYGVNNCLPGRIGATAWSPARARLGLDSSAARAAWPFLARLCTQTSVRGVSCNGGSVPASESGACSGVPTENVIRLSIVDSRRKAPWHEPRYRFCEGFPNIARMNTLAYQYYYTAENVLRPGQVSPPWADVAFLDRAGEDFGLASRSVIWKQYDGVRSCPKSQVGASDLSDDQAFKYFSVWRTVPLSY